MSPTRVTALRNAALLLTATAIATVLLALGFDLVQPAIKRNDDDARRALIGAVLPPTLYDNDLLQSAKQLPADDLLGTHRTSLAWVARRHSQATAVVLEAITADGYDGAIALLVGIDARGRVTGVRVTAQHETPGIGDYIDNRKSTWIAQFIGTSLDAPTAARWLIKSDGGAFDARAGATITPRAVVKAVKSALDYFALHRDTLLARSSAQDSA
jgi:electron transport complex protein RnfG